MITITTTTTPSSSDPPATTTTVTSSSFIIMTPPPPRSTLFPSTTLFRSQPEVTVTFSGSPAFAYSPKCFVASAGTRGIFSTNFQLHPLIGGEEIDGTKGPDPSSPITPTTSGSSAAFTL